MKLYHLIVLFCVLAAAGGQSLKFSHVKHVGENGQECATCHTGVATSENLNQGLAVSAATCRDCHDSVPADAKAFELIDPSFKINGKGRPGFVIFPHVRHLSQKMDCKICHGDLILDAKTKNEKPKMIDCASCHHHRGAPGLACLACHDRVEKSFDHASSAWVKGQWHGTESRFQEERCQMCHAPSACLNCHQGAASRAIHDLNYRFTHATDVKFKRLDCTVCHETARFCADCHEGRGR